jgi:hypothetical protein
MKRRSSKQEPVKLVLRLPPEMHERLVAAADSHAAYVSLNSEIVRRLFASLADDERLTTFDERLTTLWEAVKGRLQEAVDSMETRDLITLDGKILDALNNRAEALRRPAPRKGK